MPLNWLKLYNTDHGLYDASLTKNFKFASHQGLELCTLKQ